MAELGPHALWLKLGRPLSDLTHHRDIPDHAGGLRRFVQHRQRQIAVSLPGAVKQRRDRLPRAPTARLDDTAEVQHLRPQLLISERKGARDQIKRAWWLPRVPGGLSGRRQPGRETGLLTGELGGALVGGRGRCMTRTQLGAAGGRLERDRHLLITRHGRHRLMPDPTINVLIARERHREGGVDALALSERGPLVDGGSHERVAELDPGAVGADQRGTLRRPKRITVKPKLAERAQDNRHLAGPVDRGDQ